MGTRPGYGSDALHGMPDVFTSTATAALEMGAMLYAKGVIDNQFSYYVRENGVVFDFRSNVTLEDVIGSHEASRRVNQWHSARVSTFLTGWHCKLRPNTEGMVTHQGMAIPSTARMLTILALYVGITLVLDVYLDLERCGGRCNT
jgi:hypothetical protein